MRSVPYFEISVGHSSFCMHNIDCCDDFSGHHSNQWQWKTLVVVALEHFVERVAMEGSNDDEVIIKVKALDIVWRVLCVVGPIHPFKKNDLFLGAFDIALHRFNDLSQYTEPTLAAYSVPL